MESGLKKIIYNEEVAPAFFRMGISWKTPEIKAGQFVMLRATSSLDPLLRRPFGIYNVLGAKGGKTFKGSGIEVLYKAVGKGTCILSEKEPGEHIDILGPLGNGFPVFKEPHKTIMVAGGMGIAPLHLLSKRLDRWVLLYGARGESEASMAKDFRKRKDRIRVATEDGSVGKRGLVTGLLDEELTAGSIIYACGPTGMLKAVAKKASEEGIRCFVSLERPMACGIGVCLGCAVRTRAEEKEKADKEYKMVCSDGPVFNGEEIDWEAL